MLEGVVLGQDIMELFHQLEVVVVMAQVVQRVLEVQILEVAVAVENQELMEDRV
jgi:hypothetical protein